MNPRVRSPSARVAQPAVAQNTGCTVIGYLRVFLAERPCRLAAVSGFPEFRGIAAVERPTKNPQHRSPL